MAPDDKWTRFRRRHVEELFAGQEALEPVEVIARFLSACASAHTDMFCDEDAEDHFEAFGAAYADEARDLVELLDRYGEAQR